MDDRTQQTTRMVLAIARADADAPAAAEQLLPHVYDELRAIAGNLMRRERAAHTLQPTELIHEAWLRLVDADAVAGAPDRDAGPLRTHFTRIAARAMRFVLVDHARRKFADKRGGGQRRVTLDDNHEAAVVDPEDVLHVHDGIERLAALDPELAQIVELRFFGGMTLDEVAVARGTSRRTVVRNYRLARAWWLREFDDGGRGEPS
jgi:RNA polymerase sigma factor (TIGR02999 family)